MRTRTKILLAVALGLFWGLFIHDYGRPKAVTETSEADLRTFYDDSNTAFFDGKLPQDVVITRTEHDPRWMATTSKLPDGRFLIKMNTRYTAAQRVAFQTMLHEECHVKTWSEFDEHGPRWKACMVGLDIQGAFKAYLLDEYDGGDR